MFSCFLCSCFSTQQQSAQQQTKSKALLLIGYAKFNLCRLVKLNKKLQSNLLNRKR